MEDSIQESKDIKEGKLVSPKLNSSPLLVLVILLVAAISSLSTFLLLKISYEKSQSLLLQKIDTLETQVAPLNEHGQYKDTPLSASENPFASIPLALQTKDPSIIATPERGYLLVNSILSHDKQWIVYSAISDCIKTEQLNETSGQCQWDYRIYLKELTSEKVKQIYGYPEDKLSWFDSLIPQVNAGGCPLVYLPIGWSKNDKKIILESVNPTSCGAGGGNTKYEFASIDPASNTIEGLSNSRPTLFYDEYKKVIFSDQSENSPLICGNSIDHKNNGRIVVMDVESRQVLKTVEEANTEYILGQTSDDQTQLEYTIRNIPEVNKAACAEVDYSSVGEKHSLVLP